MSGQWLLSLLLYHLVSSLYLWPPYKAITFLHGIILTLKAAKLSVPGNIHGGYAWNFHQYCGGRWSNFFFFFFFNLVCGKKWCYHPSPSDSLRLCMRGWCWLFPITIHWPLLSSKHNPSSCLLCLQQLLSAQGYGSWLLWLLWHFHHCSNRSQYVIFLFLFLVTILSFIYLFSKKMNPYF